MLINSMSTYFLIPAVMIETFQKQYKEILNEIKKISKVYDSI